MNVVSVDRVITRQEARLPGDWPHRAHSRFVRAGGIVWHVQTMGTGPVLFLAHGTGAATHSWRDLMPLLARDFTVVAPDLPGHGFTEAPAMHRMSLPGMAGALQSLLLTLDAAPALAVGHSAGAAVLARMCLDRLIAPRGLVGLNPALLPLVGLPGEVFSPLAKLMVGLPVLPSLFALRARDPAVIGKLLRDTGSSIDPIGATLYARVVQEPHHAAAALCMMAYWNLHPLADELPGLGLSLLLIVGEGDRTVPPGDGVRVRDMVPGARLISMPRLGHLAHEECPAETAGAISGFARDCGALA